MDLFSFMSRGNSPKKSKKRKNASMLTEERKTRRPQIEPLEDRMLLTCNAITGHVFHDANSNGIFDSGEAAIANSPLELRNDLGQVIATTMTDSNGFYQFNHDETVSTAVTTMEQIVTIDPTLAGFSISRLVDQFDPSLGQLLEVEIINEGSITSDIRAENSSTHVGAHITGQVSGKITLSGPGFTLESVVSENAGVFNATPFDGVIDFDGQSGRLFSPKTAAASPKSIKLTGSQVNPFVGTGSLEFTEDVVVNSTASGGGNLLVGITSEATATFTVRYKYQPDNCLDPGQYTVVQLAQPPLPTGGGNYFDGKESKQGVVVPNSIGTDVISVTLGNTDATGNDFGEVAPASLAGFVYFDKNNDGVKQTDIDLSGQLREPGIANTLITLTGTDDRGLSVLRTDTTDFNGAYDFSGLRPGNYTLSEQQPVDFTDGKDTVGTPGGTTGSDQFSNINLQSGVHGMNNNFGENKESRLSGYVYEDLNNNGVKDAGEQGIGGAVVELEGATEGGILTDMRQTNPDGSYSFEGLQPGTYSLKETQPLNYADGKDTIGSQGGFVSDDHLQNISLGQGVNGVNNNFGERPVSGLSGYVYEDPNDNGFKEFGEKGIAGVRVELSGTAEDGTPVQRDTTTNADGSYSFDDLAPGNYMLRERQPSYYKDGKDTIGSQGGVAQNDRLTNIQLQAGVMGVNNNFGELPLARLTGYVYEDLNNNGVKDLGEAGIANVAVRLIRHDADGDKIAGPRLTRADGSYDYSNLLPGRYSIEEVKTPAGYEDGKDTIGTQGGSSANDRFFNILLDPGEWGQDNNFGERLPEISDVGIVKSATPTTVLPGGTFNYTLTVTNFGPGTARTVRVTDPLPSGVDIISVAAPGWSNLTVGNSLSLQRSSLASGAVSRITITARAPVSSGTFTNTATVTTTTTDSNPNNNKDTAVINVPTPVVSPETPPANQVLTKALILASGDFWFRLMQR